MKRRRRGGEQTFIDAASAWCLGFCRRDELRLNTESSQRNTCRAPAAPASGCSAVGLAPRSDLEEEAGREDDEDESPGGENRVRRHEDMK
ncbi:hypothetical protein EYF80_060748 [Liparis tanakae]|uniref:Uncharacterized protein n=1 Tax=Liparis tanakae TaxID=230148 RepID=A0A4Z2EK28_9TELE|nr:hypothetical protein EYF80_060748 [Liparis tanakae]